MAIFLVSCNLTTPGGPLGATSTPDLVQTLTALAPTQFSPTEVPLIPADTATSIPTAVSTLTSTPVIPTNTTAPVVPTATKTGVPVVQVTPIFFTATPKTPTAILPTAIPVNMDRISFLANATSANLSGSLTGGQVKEYALRVMANQVMMVNVSVPNQDAVIAVYGLTSGQVFLGASSNQTFWQGRVPSTQDYVVQVISRGAATNFNLSVTIPENIIFQAGAVSASRSYPLRAREMHSFLLHANAGQSMTLSLSFSDQSVLLAFYGYQDGQPYLRTVVGATSWTGTVPATQDYVIQVVSVVDNATSFKLDVTIQ